KENAELVTYKVPYVKGILNRVVEWNEVANLFRPPSEIMNIEEGDIVEITGDAFKNEKARVKRINKQKGEAVVELLQAAVPMPIFVKLDNLRVIRKEKPQTGEVGEVAKEG
ncbi:MAG: transcription elongation factor Spt5, partial [Candidatus Pacearchaeota archaeon]